MADKIIITQVRSAIRRPKGQKATLEALGCKKLNRPIEKTATPQIMGMIRKVNHLLRVDNK
jgi:large subunit ribosomal protein L30